MDDLTTTVQVRGLSEKQAMERIIKFAQRYGPLHSDLASHAAFPLVLTPDLLYRIWASFLPQIPWTTVSDILLSPLCREVGYELYEMDPAIRNILLGELREDNRFGESRFQELAHFLQEYILLNLNSDDPDQRDLAEAQHLTALASTAPDQAARELASKLSDPSQLAGADLLRVTALTATLAGQLQEYSPLVNYARGVERLVQGDKKAASDILNRVFEQESQIEISGVTLQRPRPVPDLRQAHVQETSGAETTPPIIEETSAPGAPKIFISYRRADSKYVVDRLRDRLVASLGEQSVSRDIEAIPLGVDFRTVLEREINSCNVMLVVIGPQWADITDAEGNKRLFDPGDFTRMEIETGLANPNTLLIPVLVMNARMPRAAEIPESLGELLYRNAINLRNDPDFDTDLQRLISRTSRSVAEPPPIPIEYFEPETIYIPAGTFIMGSFNAGDAPAYESPQHTVNLPAYRIGKYPVTNSQYEEFVREKQIPVAPVTGWDGQRVPPGLENHPVTGVTWYEALAYCRWLSEKTGRQYALPNEAQWEKAYRGGTNTTYPWGDEFDTARCNAGQSSTAPVDNYPPQNAFGGYDFVGNVRQWTCSLWGEKRSQPDARYLYPWKDDQRNSLSANQQIRRVVRGSSFRDATRQSRCSARSGQLPDDPGLPGLRHGFRVVMLDPAAQDVTEESTRNVSGGTIASPGGEQAAQQSWEGLAEELYNRLIPEDQVTLRRIFLKLVRPGEGLEVTSNHVPHGMLYHRAEANDRIDRVLDQLIRARLLRFSEGDNDADGQVEIANEALIRDWPRLVEWLEEERFTLRQRQRLTAAAEEWQRLNRDFSVLWQGPLLDEALHYDDLSILEAEFLEASQASGVAPTADQAEQKAKLFFSYKSNAQTDQKLAEVLAERLSALGYPVFIETTDLKVGENWLTRIDEELKSSDFFIVLLSEASVDSEMIQSEIQRAYEYRKKNGRPQVLPIRVAYEGLLPYLISAFLNPLQYITWNNESDNERVVRELVQAFQGELPVKESLEKSQVGSEEDFSKPGSEFDAQDLSEPGGTVRLQDKFYIERDEDRRLKNEMHRLGSTVTIRGSRQSGKSSLLARGLEYARQSGAKTILLDMQRVDKDHLASLDVFLRYFAEFIVIRLGQDVDVIDNHWNRRITPQEKLTLLFEDFVFDKVERNLVIGLDEVDVLSQTPFYSEFFGLMRSWHNLRAMDEVWDKLSIITVISTEPYLLISDFHQSPFNVGVNLNLQDFNKSQMQDLNQRHGSPLSEKEFDEFIQLFGGHPFLTRKALYLLVVEKQSWKDLKAKAAREDGPFGDHLRRYHWMIQQEPALRDALRSIIRSNRCSEEQLHRLLQAGLVKASGDRVEYRCDLYRLYFEDKL